MSLRAFLATMTLILALPLALLHVAAAEVVGHFTQVEGRVDLLKGGKLPAIPAKIQDGVEPGDVLRTKSLSKATVTFVDNSVITVSPESRIAIEDYQFNPAQKKRNAVLNIFQGLTHVIVNKLFNLEEPDFVVKTQTAVMGVRGTDFGVRIHPNSTTVLNFQGVTQVGNIFPEVGQLFRRAAKVAFAWGGGGGHWVTLRDMQGSTVGRGMPPTLPFSITAQDQQQFMNQMGSGLFGRKSGQGSGSGTTTGGGSGSGGSGTGSGTGTSGTDSGGTGGTGTGTGTAGTDTGGGVGGGTEFTTNLGGPGSGLDSTTGGTGSPSVPDVAPTGLTTGTGNSTVTTLTTITIPPEAGGTTGGGTTGGGTTPTPTPTPATYSFTQTGQSTWNSTSTTGTTTSVTSTGWGLRTGVATADTQALPAGYTGFFTSSGAGDRTVVQGSLFSGNSTGVTTSTLTGTVTGIAGGTLTGTATMTGTSSFGQTTSFTGTVTIDPSGVLTFTYGGANGTATNTSQARLATATGVNTYTPGNYFTQTLYGSMSDTASSPYYTQNSATVWGGATTSSGPLAQYYATAITGSQTSPWGFRYLGQSYSSFGGIIQGVLNSTTLLGAATITPYDADAPFVSSLATPPSPYLFGAGADATLPIVTTINTSTGVINGTVHTTDYQEGKYASGVYTLTQTPQAAAVPPITGDYNFTETYTGAFGFASTSPSSGTTYSSGYGYRSGTGALAPYFNGYFNSRDNGAWTGAGGSLPSPGYGSALVTGSGTVPGTTMLSGLVAGTLGQNLTGPMTWIGSLLNGISFNYQGTVTLNGYGELQFVYGGSSGTATWTDLSGVTNPASGTMYQYPGYFFTQTMPGTYALNTSGNTGTLTLAGNSGTRSMVYGGNLGPFSGLFNLYSDSTLPASSSGTLSQDLYMEGVVGTSHLGASYGAASVAINTSPIGLSVTVPGTVSLSPGNTNFIANGVFVQSNAGPIQVYSYTGPTVLPTGLTQLPLYGFSETFNGFRISAGSTPFTLAGVEGYGWGTITGTGGTPASGILPLPTSYTSNATTGYFVSQDLGTRASLLPMTPGWAGVTGTMTGTLSGDSRSGQTLTGQMLFTGTNSLGATFNYQGNATLASNGTLVWNYNGTWTAGSNSGTASGTWTQVLGTYFTETINSGSYVQAAASTTIGTTTYANKTVQDTAPLGGTRTVGTGSPTATTASYAGIRTSTVNTFSSGGGTPNLTVQGVVAGSTWETRWGVATVSGAGSPAASTGTSGPVTLDPTGKLTGQFVNSIPNSAGQPADNVTVNLVSVPTVPLVSTDPQQTTSSFVQTVSGTINQTPVGATPSTQATLTTAAPLTGTGTGTIPGNINANLNLTTNAITPTYVTAGPGQMSAKIIGAVGGPASGTQTGVASMHSLKTVGGQTRALRHLGTATHQPAAGTTPPTLTVNVNGLNPSRTGVAAAQTGTVTVTPKP